MFQKHRKDTHTLTERERREREGEGGREDMKAHSNKFLRYESKA